MIVAPVFEAEQRPFIQVLACWRVSFALATNAASLSGKVVTVSPLTDTSSAARFVTRLLDSELSIELERPLAEVIESSSSASSETMTSNATAHVYDESNRRRRRELVEVMAKLRIAEVSRLIVEAITAFIFASSVELAAVSDVIVRATGTVTVSVAVGTRVGFAVGRICTVGAFVGLSLGFGVG